MSTRTVNGEIERPRTAGTAKGSDSASTLAEVRRALAATQRRCGALLRELDRARRLETARDQEAVLLKEAVLRTRRFAYHDELTGLPNRHLLLDRFNLAMALATRHRQQVALLFLDLDGFKDVNDTLGHMVGDKLLQQVAARVLACIRASDTACRYGGDEFVVLLSEIAGMDGAAVVAENIRVRLAAPHFIHGVEVVVTASLGMALYPGDAGGYDELLRLADLAMYRDKTRRSDAPRLATLPLG